MIERIGTACHRLRRRWIPRPLCLRIPVPERGPGPRRAARPAQRLFHPAARPGRPVRLRSGRHHEPRQRPQRRARRERGRSTCAASSAARCAASMSTAPAMSPKPRARPAPRSLVHVSAIGADPDAHSAYGRTKGEGEQAIRDAFPPRRIIRPSLVFGPEDDFTNRFAAMARLPVPSGDRGQRAISSRSMSATSPRRSRWPRSTRGHSAARPTRSAARR